MTKPQLSPAAQVVLQAVHQAMAEQQFALSGVPDYRQAAAAALRAAADQVVPHEATAPWDELKCDYDGDHWEMRQWVRHQFLAIAAELKGQ